MSLKPIFLEAYSPRWKKQFQELAQLYHQHLGDLAIGIEHVGSTAVEGLCAKPVIDIDIIIESTVQLKEIIPIFKQLGYEYLGEVAIPDRFVFRQSSPKVPNDGSHRSWPKHHLYCCIAGSTALANHLILRDSLKADTNLATAYAALKILLSQTSANMDEYVMGKTEFIAQVLAQGGVSAQQIELIAEQNKSVIPVDSRNC